MKNFFKNILIKILGNQVKRLRKKHNFKIIGVAGSIGKTSTKLAIAKVLASKKRVRFQEGNYNDIVSVPFVLFGQNMPPLFNIFSWIVVLCKNEYQIYSKFPFDVVVLELGTDGPNQIEQFRKYLYLDIAVVTAITPEHMEFFENINEVAEEEFSISFWSDIIFVNKDLCKTLPQNIDHKKIVFYGRDFGCNYKIENILKENSGISFDLYENDKKIDHIVYNAVSEVQLYSVCVSYAIAKKFGLNSEEIKNSLKELKSFSGRMQKLKGIKNSLIIDDSYNSSPDAVKIALDTLYQYDSNQKIAILGMMNELGHFSVDEHIKMGKYCNPNFIDILVTVGKDANEYTAKIAKENGCFVYKAKDAVDAGNFVAKNIKEGAVVLVKGSQNGVFVEESIKEILADKNDISKLVRQEEYWLKKKYQT